MKEKIEIGRKIYLKPINNASRYSNEILEAEVVKVGRKYFEINRGAVKKYYIETLQPVSEYVPDYKIYFSEQEIFDEREYDKLLSQIRSKFDMWAKKDLTLEQLRKITKIIAE